MPEVTVLMPVFNGEQYVLEAIQSILDQSFSDFEYLIIDDGSTDRTNDIVQSVTDKRVQLFRNERNIGLVRTLNFGLERAKGKYIARMDSDDISLPRRIEKQVAFLERHPETGLLGTSAQVIDSNGRPLATLCWPETDLQVRWTSLLNNPFGHPTIMLRRDLLDRHQLNFDETVQSAEDYDLWTRIMAYTKGANLQEALLYYRIHGASITRTTREIQLRSHDAISMRNIGLQLAEFSISAEDLSGMRGLFVGGAGYSKPLTRTRQINLANKYLDMLDCFARKHQADSGITTLQRDATVGLTRFLLNARFAEGWVLLAERLFALNPLFPLGALQRLADRFWRRALRMFAMLGRLRVGNPPSKMVK